MFFRVCELGPSLSTGNFAPNSTWVTEKDNRGISQVYTNDTGYLVGVYFEATIVPSGDTHRHFYLEHRPSTDDPWLRIGWCSIANRFAGHTRSFNTSVPAGHQYRIVTSGSGSYTLNFWNELKAQPQPAN